MAASRVTAGALVLGDGVVDEAAGGFDVVGSGDLFLVFFVAFLMAFLVTLFVTFFGLLVCLAVLITWGLAAAGWRVGGDGGGGGGG